jgi:hypothetical protein
MTNKTLDTQTLDRIATSATSFLLADGGKGWIGARTGEYAGKSSSLEVFTGDIPTEAREALFRHTVESVPMQATYLTPDGVRTITDESRRVQVRTDLGMMLGVSRDGKRVHRADEWAIDPFTVTAKVGLRCAVLGTLGYGARSFAQFTGGTVLTDSGVSLLPTITFFTSVDGSLVSDFSRGGSILACNNQIGSFGAGRILKNISAVSRLRIKHTSKSDEKRALVLPAFGIETYETMVETLTSSIDTLASIVVTDEMLADFLDLYAPVAGKEKATLTRAENTRDRWTALYRNDARCSAWQGTALGILQTSNTYSQHVAEIRGADTDRITRQADSMLAGRLESADVRAADMLSRVLVGSAA